MSKLNEQRVENIVQAILTDYEDIRAINKRDIYNHPDKKAIIEIVEKLMMIIYPGYYGDKVYRSYSLKNNMSAAIEDVIYHLHKQIMLVLRCTLETENNSEVEEKAESLTCNFSERFSILIFRQHLTAILRRKARMRSFFPIRECMLFQFTESPMSYFCWMFR